jgi:FtsP/CotA-like multicopper oxidase with cupredoxin domain
VHPESPDLETDLNFLKQKIENGVSFLITQLFFEVDLYFDFVEAARDAGIEVPIIPGIMPIRSYEQITRFAALCGATIPDRLADVPEPEKPDGAVVRRWHFRQANVHGRRGWGINGKPFDPAVPQAQVPLGSTEIWEFFTDAHHPVHVHLSPFQVLRRGNRGPGPMDLGWKDTVDVRPYEAVRVRVRFERYAGRFLIHCHNLEHEDMAMMAGFETV